MRLAGIRLGICGVAACLFIPSACTAQAPTVATVKPPSFAEAKPASELSFVRQFSSAEDIRREHPVLDRTLDIIAGPKTDVAPADVLQIPSAVTTDAQHRVFVADIGARRVHVFDFGRSKYSVFQGGGDRLHWPAGLAADREGNLYVTDRGSGAILVYDAKGKFRRYLKESKKPESYFQAPWGIAIDPATQRIYVCDTPRHMVIVLDKKGHVLDRFGKRGGGTGAGDFRYPTQVVAAGGEIVVLDLGNRRVQVFDVRGHFRREFRLDDADQNSGLAVDYQGNVYVSDAVVNRIQVFWTGWPKALCLWTNGTGCRRV
jgi:DNA-binding beta-propeller fold protein YncE